MGDLQLSLLNYAKFYDGLYKLPPSDKPTDDIILDDAKLDRWYDQWKRDLERKSAQPGAPPGSGPPVKQSQVVDLSDVFTKRE